MIMIVSLFGLCPVTGLSWSPWGWRVRFSHEPIVSGRQFNHVLLSVRAVFGVCTLYEQSSLVL